MNLAFAIERLNQNAVAIQALVTVDDAQARWKPTAEAWSILEVLNHLVDEEREDFRRRLDYTLHRPGEPWPPIDPRGWVISRAYNQRDPQESLASFLVERGKSLTWLRGLEAPNWSNVHEHATAGPLLASDVLASWVAHDGLHLRQLVELHRAFLAVALPGDIRYAGEW